MTLKNAPSGAPWHEMNAGRLAWKPLEQSSSGENVLQTRGVLPEFAVRDSLAKTAAPEFAAWLKDLKSKDTSKEKPVDASVVVAVPGNASEEELSSFNLKQYNPSPIPQQMVPQFRPMFRSGTAKARRRFKFFLILRGESSV